MKLSTVRALAIFVALELVLLAPASAQHSIQIDDGAGHVNVLSTSPGLTLPVTSFQFPTTGGTLLTQSAGLSSAWLTSGNVGTNPTTNFLGTTDNTDLVFRTNNAEQLRLSSVGSVGLGMAPSSSRKLSIKGNASTVNGLYLDLTTVPVGGGSDGIKLLLTGNASSAVNGINSSVTADVPSLNYSNASVGVMVHNGLGTGTGVTGGVFSNAQSGATSIGGSFVSYGNVGGSAGADLIGMKAQGLYNGGTTGTVTGALVLGSGGANCGNVIGTSSYGYLFNNLSATGVLGVAYDFGTGGSLTGGSFYATGNGGSTSITGIQSTATSFNSTNAVGGYFEAYNSSGFNYGATVNAQLGVGTNIGLGVNSVGANSTGIKFLANPTYGVDVSSTYIGYRYTGTSTSTYGLNINMASNPVGANAAGISLNLTGQSNVPVNGIDVFTTATIPSLNFSNGIRGVIVHNGLGKGAGVTGGVFSNAQSGATSLGGSFIAYGNVGGSCAADLVGLSAQGSYNGGTTGYIYGAEITAFGGALNAGTTGLWLNAIGSNATQSTGLLVSATGSSTLNIGVSVAATGAAATGIAVTQASTAIDVGQGSVRSSASAGARFADTQTLAGGAATEVITNSIATAGSTIILTFEGTAARAAALGSLLITARNNGSFTVGNANNINFANTDIVHYMIVTH